MGAPGPVFRLPFRPGFGMPSSEIEAQAECLRLELELEHARDRGPELELHAQRRQELQDQLVVSLNPNVTGVEGDSFLLEVNFGRYRGSEQLEGPDAELLQAIRAPLPLSALGESTLACRSELLSRLRELEAKGLVDLRLEDAACSAVGT